MSDRPWTGAAAEAKRIVDCHECGLRHAMGDLPPQTRALCGRCGASLMRVPVNSLDRSLALTITGFVLLAIAMTFPFMSLTIQGRIQQADLVTGVIALAEQGLWSLAAVVFLTTIGAPSLKLGATLYVLVGLRLRRAPPYLPLVFRWLEFLHPWAMVEVYLLGVFVAYVKLIDLASIGLGPAFYSLATLMVVMVAIDGTLGSELVWREMERRRLVPIPPYRPGARLVLCEECGLTSPMVGHHGACARCGARLHLRKQNSLSRCWALTITAAILYIPANAFPIMTVISFGHGEPDTIMSGIKALFLGGMWPLALLVFFASVTVPVLKLIGIVFLLISTQRASRWRLRDRAVLYRIVEAVGRWSMIDIFMLSILAGLVQLGSIATIAPGVGAISFAAVVITTMFAATAFDPRLMWDAAGKNT